MSASYFELDWLGGAAEKSFRRVRPDIADLPWGTLSSSFASPAVVERARFLWTQVAISEYRAAIAFSQVLSAMLAASAPLDLIGMAGAFVADEVAHVEMASRMAMELGGAAPVSVDWRSLTRASDVEDAFSLANDRILKSVCVSETLSGAVAVDTMKELDAPLPKAVLTTIARDEARHTRVGWLYMEWAAPRMTDEERGRLGKTLEGSLRSLGPLVKRGRRTGYAAEDRASLLRLGWLDRAPYAASARDAVLREVLAPLATYGIEISRSAHEELFGEVEGA
jgi:hypothetical protein